MKTKKCHNNKVLEYKIDLYFPKHKLEIEVDECSHIDRTGDNEREEKMKKKKLDCKFIIINHDGDDHDEYIKLGRIRTYIHESKKIDRKISYR